MQGSEEKKRVGRHAAPEPELAPHENVIRAETNLYGDETDIPIKKRKPKKETAPKKPKKEKKKAAKKPSKPKKKIKLIARLTVSEVKYTRADRGLIEIISTDGENSKFKALMIFGHQISFWPMLITGVLIVLLALVFMNNTNLAVDQQTVTVVGLPVDLEDYRMLVVSDLNGKRFGDEQSSLLRTINNLDYDAVFFLGDMIGKTGDPKPFFELLDGIPASKEVYFICGDSDPGPFVSIPREITGTLPQLVLEDWILGAIERGATYVDSPVALNVGSSTIWVSPSTLLNMEAGSMMNTWEDQMEQEEDGVLSGLQADYNTLPITSYRCRVAQNYYNITPSMKEEDFHLILSHEVPSEDSIYAAASHANDEGRYLKQPELVLAGHYCGGVWKLPLIGAFYIPDNMLPRNGWFPSQTNAQGLSSVGETQVYITPGLSTNGDTPVLAFRLLNQPQISLLTLTATLPENMLSAQ